MSFTINLESEDNRPIQTLHSLGIFESYLQASNIDFILLKYLDPYGDTTFNHVQMDDLKKDLAQLKQLGQQTKETDLIMFISALMQLADQCKKGVHLYMKFIGD